MIAEISEILNVSLIDGGSKLWNTGIKAHIFYMVLPPKTGSMNDCHELLYKVDHDMKLVLTCVPGRSLQVEKRSNTFLPILSTQYCRSYCHLKVKMPVEIHRKSKFTVYCFAVLIKAVTHYSNHSKRPARFFWQIYCFIIFTETVTY